MVSEEKTCENPIFFVLGATGCGKSLAAIRAAKTLKDNCGFEHVIIVNCDVMQFYADLPIATNKVSFDEMEGIPHYFMGFLSPLGTKIRDPTLPYRGSDKEEPKVEDNSKEDESYNIHSYVRDAVEFIEGFVRYHSSSAVIVCGGTCYYAQALLFDNVLTTEDIKDSVSCDTELSSLLSLENQSGQYLWDELNRIDPAIASRYHPNDTRRIFRLLDIYNKTNCLPSEIYTTRSDPCFRFCPTKCFILWIHCEYEKLKELLDKRVDKMVKQGIVEEFIQFTERRTKYGLDVGLTNAIGYKEFLTAFDITESNVEIKGESELRKSIDLLKTNTKRYARQQERWIKNRFLGRLRFVFNSFQETRNFVCIDSSKMISQFITTVENVTEFLVKRDQEQINGITFPLAEIKEKPPTVKYEWCEICEMFVSGGNQMDIHLKSKRHQGAVRHAKLVKDQKEKYGRVIPPKKRRIS